MFIVTDLTRFSEGNPNVCTALIDSNTGRCVRPMPYFTYDVMRRHEIMPGAKFSGVFTSSMMPGSPHIEDCTFSDMKHHGPATKADFRNILMNSSVESVVAGFGPAAAGGGKVIPLVSPPACSLITIQVAPSAVFVVEDAYSSKKLKLNFTDASGAIYRYMPITDLGFHEYAQRLRSESEFDSINLQIHNASEIFLRVGLSRPYKAPDGREGWWIQVNGIYTFPKKIDIVRGYKD